MTDLRIRYDNGEMVIHLEEFLSCRSIAKVKKLLVIIQRSYNPEAADQLQQYIRNKVEELDALTKALPNRYVRLKEEVRNIQNDVDVWKSQRDRNTKNSSPYIYSHDRLKISREKLRDAKKLLNTVKCEFDNHVKNKAFLNKLLSEIFD